MHTHPTISGRDFVYDPPIGPADILHEDDDLLVVNKPSGLLSVPGKAAEHKDCLEKRILNSHPEARIVHRLDMATSGVIIFALNAKAHRHLGLQFERRHLKKRYLTRVWGQVLGQTGRINLPLICDWPNRPLQKVDFEHGKPSQTDWEIIGHDGNTTSLRLYPYTGRSHQLRVHFLALGHPILGDRLYAHNEAFSATDRLMLHAESLEIRHPANGAFVRFTAPSPVGISPLN